MGGHTAWCKMLLFCAKTIVKFKDSCHFQLDDLRKMKKLLAVRLGSVLSWCLFVPRFIVIMAYKLQFREYLTYIVCLRYPYAHNIIHVDKPMKVHYFCNTYLLAIIFTMIAC